MNSASFSRGDVPISAFYIPAFFVCAILPKLKDAGAKGHGKAEKN
jgi:hypothetical protein